MNQQGNTTNCVKKSVDEEKTKKEKNKSQSSIKKPSSDESNVRSNVNVNICRNVLSTASSFEGKKTKGDERSESKKKRKSDLSVKSTQPKNSPQEAFISCLDTVVPDVHDKPIITEDVLKELTKANINKLTGTTYDPERFLRPPSNPEMNFLDRHVNPHKIYDYLVSYMNEYYDISKDRNPYSEWREKMDEKLWDNFAYVIPLLCRQVVDEVLRYEPIIITLMPDAVVFGDIHGNLNDIHYIYKKFICDKKYSSYKFVFLGDYVDRGPKSIEVVLFLLACKLIEPKRYILLRGNHEVSKVNKKYGFRCLVEHIYQDTYIKNRSVLVTLIYESFNRTFNYLPLASVIRYKDGQKGIFCCHGGIPNESYKNDKKAWKISELNNFTNQFKPHNLIPRKNCNGGQAALNELLWNDPIPKHIWKKKEKKFSKLYYKNKKRGGHCSWFTEEAANRFLEANNLKIIIRGHQYRNCKDKGYCYNFSNQVLTVFSSSNYCGTEENVTGCVLITEEMLKAQVLRSIEESKTYQGFNVFELIMDENTKKVTGVMF